MVFEICCIFAVDFEKKAVMDEYVKRDVYLNRLIVRRDNNLIKAVTGPRRAGKSFLLNPIFKDYLLGQGAPEDHIISISFDIEDEDIII